MFSRVGRLTTFGAQAVSNCPFRRDNIYQQPLKVTAPINDQLVNFAHNFSDSLRPRTTSFGNDPFLGVPMDDEEVIKELELLDLDAWNPKPRPPCAAPSDELEVDQFWEGKNVTVCGRDPRIPPTTEHFELEAWRPTDTWNAPQGHQQTTSQGHSSTSEMIHNDFGGNFGDNMGSPLFRSPSKSSIDQFTGHSHSQNHQNQHNRALDDFQATFFGSHTSTSAQKVPKFEMDVENASKAVDWEAWNHYLDSEDDAFKRPESYFTTPEDSTTTSTSSPDSGFDILDMMAPPPTPALPMTALAPSTFQNHLNLGQMTSAAFRIQQQPRVHPDIDLFSSGPLICAPKEEEPEFFDNNDDEDYVPTSESHRRQSTRVRKPNLRRREESERSWTPASDDWMPEAKFKKRGVVLKPSVDEETDRRRALNRVAAVRYREKKRAEKMGRKREFQDVVDRNRILIQKERQLKREITAMKKELRKMGAIIH